MPNNQTVLEELFNNYHIDIRRGKIFDTPPEPMSERFNFDKVEGMMVGLAIGDSLGKPTESMLPKKRLSRFGQITEYMPSRYANGHPIGVPSDDTQLAFWTLEQMIEDGGFNPSHVAQRFCRDRIFGIGSAVSRFVNNFEGGIPWYEAGPRSAGNGALMRIAPMLIPHLKAPSWDLYVDTALSAMITHNDSSSIASCVAFVRMLWELLGMDRPPEPHWWIETFVEVARDLEINLNYRPRGGIYKDTFEGPLWRFVQEKVSEAFHRHLSALDACGQWYSGAYLLETVPSVIYILMKHGDNLEEAIVRAVNDTKDNDTIGAIVGAAIGALYGKSRIPSRWIENLSGRTSVSDDGRIFEELEQARTLWG